MKLKKTGCYPDAQSIHSYTVKSGVDIKFISKKSGLVFGTVSLLIGKKKIRASLWFPEEDVELDKKFV